METTIRELAYQKWEAAGCPPTSEDERNRFWFEAEQEVLKKPAPSRSSPPESVHSDQTVCLESRYSEETVAIVNRWNIPGINIK
jgi:hypothetical protein